MLDEQRAVIAAITSAICNNKKNINNVYSFHQSKYIIISGTITNKSIEVYDHNRGVHITGSNTSLYDYGTCSHINLELKGNQFSGYDYNSSSHFSGSINSSSVTIYDYMTSQHYSFST